MSLRISPFNFAFAFLVAGPTAVFAQPVIEEPAPRPDVLIKRLASFPAPLQSIDATTRSITVGSFQPAPGTAPVPINGGVVRMQLVPGAPQSIPLAPNVVVVRRQHALPSDQLQVGDTVTLLGQKAPAGAIRLVNPQPTEVSRLFRTGEARYGVKTELFKVVSLAPLVLRLGGDPDGDDVVNVPFTNGQNTPPIGTIGIARSRKALDIYVGNTADKGDTTIPMTITDWSITLNLNNTKDLEFDKFTALNLADVAADFAAGKISVQPEYQMLKDGKKQVKRLIVTDTR